jgi:hypothetical protein
MEHQQKFWQPNGMTFVVSMTHLVVELTINEKIAGFKSFLQVHHWLWTWPRNSLDFASCFGDATWNVSTMKYGIGLKKLFCW